MAFVKLNEGRPSYPSMRPTGNYDKARGSIGEYQKMKRDCADFKDSLKRQDRQYELHYKQVEGYCRSQRPFREKPYRDWLGTLQSVWTMAFKDQLSSWTPSYAFRESGVRYQDLRNLEAISQETTVKGKKVKTPRAPKAVKPPKVTHNIIGVRFMRGHNLGKVYSYTVPKKTKLHLGEEIVVPSFVDGFETNNVAVVVTLNPTPDYTGPLKQIYGRVQPVKA